MCTGHYSLRRLHPGHAPHWGTCGCRHTRPKLGPGLRQAPHAPPLLPPTSQALGGTQKSEPVISGNRNPSEKPRVTDTAHPRFPASVRDVPVGPRHQGGTGPSAESTVDRPPRNDGCGQLQTRPTLVPAQLSGCGRRHVPCPPPLSLHPPPACSKPHTPRDHGPGSRGGLSAAEPGGQQGNPPSPLSCPRSKADSI